jgi:succinate-acetate transporter protein
MNAAKYGLLAWLALNTVVLVLSIGNVRKVRTPQMVVAGLIEFGIAAWLVVIA